MTQVQPALQPHRAEKVFIFYEKERGQWLTVPAAKPVTPGQDVRWRVFGAEKVEPDLAGAFDPPNPAVQQGKGFHEFQARVRDVAPGSYTYNVVCDGQSAQGGSLPRVIVD